MFQRSDLTFAARTLVLAPERPKDVAGESWLGTTEGAAHAPPV